MYGKTKFFNFLVGRIALILMTSIYFFVEQAVFQQQLLAAFQQRLPSFRIFLQCVPQVALRQTEQIGIADTAHIGRPTVARLVAGDIEDADFAEDATGAQSHEDDFTVVGADTQFASFDDVHLFADVTFTANVITRAEHLQLNQIRLSFFFQIYFLKRSSKVFHFFPRSPGV